MNSNEAKNIIEKRIDYKYVCKLVPPIIFLAKMNFGSHAKIGVQCNLVKIDFSLDPPYEIMEPDNFKAGRLTIEPDGTVKQTGYSADFSNPENAFLPDEFQTFFETANIELIS